MRLGFDVDGVLADFDSTFIKLLVGTSHRDLFPPRPFDIPCWDFPEYYGYTHREISAAWDRVKADAKFWWELHPCSDASQVLSILGKLAHHHDIYFITHRVGVLAKQQTEDWLRWHTTNQSPTVLISSRKDLCAHALGLAAYIDDKAENALSVGREAPTTTSYLLDRPWNRRTTPMNRVVRVSSVLEMLQQLKLVPACLSTSQ